MRLLILGASGRCGRWLARLAGARGHEITVLVRPAAELESLPGLRVFRGSVLDATLVEAAVQGQDAVASCLGLRRAGLSPWAPLRSPSDLTTRVATLLLQAMERAAVRRLVVLSAAGVRDSSAQLSPSIQWLVRQGSIAMSYRDLSDMEQVLCESDLDWLAVRPVTLRDGPPTGRAVPVSRYTLWSTVRRGDVARYMLGALERGGPFRHQAVLLGSS